MSVAAPANPGRTLAPGDLAELIASFNEVTGKLERTHESLRLEVARLQGELRDANEQLQRSRRLAALGEMAAGIAHEVRNPLASIRLYARMLEQDLSDRPAERSVATKIASAVVGLDGIVGDVLSFARDAKVSCEPVDGSELLERAVEACRGVPGADSVRVVVRASSAALRCDPVLMHQALVNVVRNALQAMAEAPAPPEGHTLTVKAETGRAECRISIGDTGPGVSGGVIDRMFNPFFTTRKTGTGLGLAIVHRIIDAHGGRIAVRNSGERPGTTFELSWPAVRAGKTSVARRHDGAEGGSVSAGVQEACR
jgi:signal transduction histidine kinase